MANAAADAQSSPKRDGRGDRVHFEMEVDIGATGAPTVAHKDDPGFGISRNTTGIYDLTYPKCARAFIDVMIKSAASTVTHAHFTAVAPSSGTAQFTTFNSAATPAVVDPANGDKLILSFELDATVLI